jgi:hypothetical protein
MTSLVWGATGDRIYEAGVDRGVLYPPNGIGVPWSGLTSVKESPSGGTPTAYYLDGIKYLQVAAAEDFNATIAAFSAPPEFAQCDGTGSLYRGLFITQQPRVPFNLSYRTLVGNDVDDLGYGYKIHLIYNALAKPSGRDHQSISNSPTPLALSWDLTTVPVWFDGFKPSAHMIIDSRLSGADVMTALEAMLYGTDTSDPAFPQPADLIAIFDNYGAFTVTDLGNGHYTADGEAVQIANPDLNFTIDDASVTDNGDGTFTINY